MRTARSAPRLSSRPSSRRDWPWRDLAPSSQSSDDTADQPGGARFAATRARARSCDTKGKTRAAKLRRTAIMHGEGAPHCSRGRLVASAAVREVNAACYAM
eukprot:2354130-Pleurochrysis_carterae.AAC.1